MSQTFLDIKHTNKEELNKLVHSFAITTFGSTFKFRQKQKETIVNIIYDWFLNDKDDIILSAPTGSGKSYIAMIVGGVLSNYFGLSGYVLISDLSLLKQYSEDLDMYLQNWGVIRGQQTYICQMNGCSFQSGVCKLAGCNSYYKIKEEYPECANYCEYILAREKAMESKVTVCTYPFWLLQQNYVRKKMELEDGDSAAPFKKRDFVICDEAHKLLDIVQNHFSPRFGKDDQTKINLVIDNMRIQDKEKTKKAIFDLREKIKHTSSENTKELYESLEDYVHMLGPLDNATCAIKKPLASNDHLSKSDRSIIYACDFVNDHFKKFAEYVNIISRSGAQYIIKNDSDLDKDKITFNCLNESYLMKRVFHDNCCKKMYTSATIGDPKNFSHDIACNDYSYIELPPVFDYSKSPIYYVNEYKMSFKDKDTSFPRVVEMIHAILNMYKDKRGIVQTGSYSFAKKLFDMLPTSDKKRILLYDDSRDKQDRLDDLKFCENKVLVGPSLIEGLSLDDDLCRFQIIMKVPYPSLADKYVATKNKFNPIWYSNMTSISMLQGVGRGVRNEHDWCVTFILDACFTNLFNKTKTMFSNDFVERIQVIPSSTILGNI